MYAAATLTPATSLGNPNIAIFDDDSPIPLMYVGGIARGGAIQVRFIVRIQTPNLNLAVDPL